MKWRYPDRMLLRFEFSSNRAGMKKIQRVLKSSNMIKAKIISSLEKVFPLDEPPCLTETGVDSVFLNETYSFQVAYIGLSEKNQALSIETQRDGCDIRLYSVGLVPCELPAYPNHDEGYLKTEPGLYPDVLYPTDEGDVLFAQPGFWRSVWVDCIPRKAGACHASVKLIAEDGQTLAECEKKFEAIDRELPEQELMHTEWFHCDCISNYYNVEMMSEEHWKLIESYVKFAADNGINMILTPIFTPPLDTREGGERPTMQLVDVILKDEKYLFGFCKLKRWVDMSISCGIKYFEMSHLFTQWGAKHAPKIIAEVNGEKKRIFGWETDAAGKEYKVFLDAFLPRLTDKLKEWNVSERCVFHISDEPQPKDIENYRAAKEIVAGHLRDFRIMDALSDFEFYESGLVGNPVCSNDHIKPFLEAKVRNMWTYYCCAQQMGVSNRFIAMPSYRNRVIGFQLYKYDIAGFLHWGYNFWNTRHSVKKINPYQVTDGGCAFPSGDPFLVYPGEDGPIPSIRLKVFSQALYDLRALKLLELVTSKEHVLGILEKDLDEPLSFDRFPKGKDYIHNTRMKINDEIRRC